jgi:hypothetical protein
MTVLVEYLVVDAAIGDPDDRFFDGLSSALEDLAGYGVVMELVERDEKPSHIRLSWLDHLSTDRRNNPRNRAEEQEMRENRGGGRRSLVDEMPLRTVWDGREPWRGGAVRRRGCTSSGKGKPWLGGGGVTGQRHRPK